VNIHPQPPFPRSATSTAGLFPRAEANPSAPMNFIRKVPHTAVSTFIDPTSSSFLDALSEDFFHRSAAYEASMASHASSAPPSLPPQASVAGVQAGYSEADAEGEDDDDVSRESTPASPPYPKPGTGLMARLKSDEEDLEWLVGDAEEEKAFNHVVFQGQEKGAAKA